MRKECEACGVEDELIVCSSSFSAESFGLCKSCFANDIYPYDALVVQTWSIGGADKSTDWFKETIRNNLVFHDISEEQFSKDIEAIDSTLGDQ